MDGWMGSLKAISFWLICADLLKEKWINDINSVTYDNSSWEKFGISDKYNLKIPCVLNLSFQYPWELELSLSK